MHRGSPEPEFDASGLTAHPQKRCEKPAFCRWGVAKPPQTPRLVGLAAFDSSLRCRFRRGEPVYATTETGSTPVETTPSRSGGHAFFAYGNVRNDKRYRVHINDQPGNGWNP